MVITPVGVQRLSECGKRFSIPKVFGDVRFPTVNGNGGLLFGVAFLKHAVCIGVLVFHEVQQTSRTELVKPSLVGPRRGTDL